MKYPRTFHVPSSPGATSDDKRMTASQYARLLSGPVVVTIKMDGQNTTMTSETCHARSLESVRHPASDYVKGQWAKIRHLLPGDMRVHGENVYAEHSIRYENLPDWFMVFGVSQGDQFLSWDETCEWAIHLGFPLVPVVYQGILKEVEPLTVGPTENYSDIREGVVIRNSESFAVSDFSQNVGKWVRKGHVTTQDHWMYQEVKVNGRV